MDFIGRSINRRSAFAAIDASVFVVLTRPATVRTHFQQDIAND